MKRSSIRMGAAAAAVALTLAGCSSGTSTDSNSSNAPADGAIAELHAMLPENIRQSGVIKLATDASWPPCEYLENNKMIGFEPDLWNAIAAKLGVKVEAESIAFDGLIPGVQSKRYDMAMECLTDNEERQQQIDFVDMFYSTIGTLVPKDNPHGVSDDPLSLCGLKLATVTGSDLAGYVDSIINPLCVDNGRPPTDAQEFPAQAQVMLALNSKRVDVTPYSMSAGAYLIDVQHQPYTMFKNDSLPKKYSGPVFHKDNDALQNAWLAGVKAIQQDGQYQQIMEHWGVDANNLDDPGINLATARPLPTQAG